jgi:hypothetical protein
MMFNANLLAIDANYSNLKNYAFDANYLNLENYARGLPINKIAPTPCMLEEEVPTSSAALTTSSAS